jgi:hypothetical protein
LDAFLQSGEHHAKVVDLAGKTGEQLASLARTDAGYRYALTNMDPIALTGNDPPTAQRVATWIDQGIHIEGRPEWIFVKVHTHGAEERAAQALLGGGMELMWTELERQFRDRPGYQLHYVSAWEMAQTVQRLCQSAAKEKT